MKYFLLKRLGGKAIFVILTEYPTTSPETPGQHVQKGRE
jgi:hypothetical protein